MFIKKLSEEHVGKLISFTYHDDRFYDKALIVKDDSGFIYLCNNCFTNANNHPKTYKKEYRYSLMYHTFEDLNKFIYNIRLLNIEYINSYENYEIY